MFKKIIIFLYLDLISIPGLFMNAKHNAKYHLKYICPHCPQYRRIYRCVNKNENCWWEKNWVGKNYSIPRHFGIFNWIKTYLGIKTNLKKYK